MNDLKTRGVEDILIAVDGLKGFPEAIEAVFPQAAVQTYIVHLIRNSLDFVSGKDRRPVVAELRKIYRAADAETGRKALDTYSGWLLQQMRGLGRALHLQRRLLQLKLGLGKYVISDIGQHSSSRWVDLSCELCAEVDKFGAHD